MRADQPTTYQFEFRMHPQDTRSWSGIGPRVNLHCTGADAKEGFAAPEIHKVHYFLDFTPIDRGQGRAYIVHTLTLGNVLPLHLELPSTQVLVQQGGRRAQRRHPVLEDLWGLKPAIAFTETNSMLRAS